jgi:cytochrome c oxidase subunit 3
MSTDSHSSHGDEHHHFAHHFRDANHEFETAKQGIWLFMVTEILMFGGLFVGYAIFHNIYPEMFSEGARQLNWVMGFINTMVLITSSLTMALGIYYCQTNQKSKAVMNLAMTILCGAIFMVIKFFEYKAKFEHGFLPGRFLDLHHTHAEHANLGMYFGFYFCMTGLHGIHVLVGMGLISWVLIRTAKGEFGPDYYTPVEGVGIFWHIVDLIWIFLFPLLYLIG